MSTSKKKTTSKKKDNDAKPIAEVLVKEKKTGKLWMKINSNGAKSEMSHPSMDEDRLFAVFCLATWDNRPYHPSAKPPKKPDTFYLEAHAAAQEFIAKCRAISEAHEAGKR